MDGRTVFEYHEVITVQEITVVERARSGQGGSEGTRKTMEVHQIIVHCLASSDSIIPDKLGR